MRPGLLQLINPAEPKYPYDVQYIKKDEAFCSSVTNITFLVIVLSSTTNFYRRQTLRKTWANESLYTSYGTLKVVFLLGITDKAKVQIKIDKEFNLYGDMVQGAFLDTYDNLTHKSTMGFKWATERCRNAKYVIKTDDDVVINMFDLFQNSKLSESENKTHVLCHRQSTMILRNESEKWFVSHYQFKGMSRFPPYCGGLFVMILNEVVPYLYKSVSKTPFFWLEDVLLYGIALNNIPGLKIEAIRENIELFDINASLNCLNKRKKKCPLFVFMTVTVNEIVNLWATILQVYNR
ncbi:UDP-GalNAc:beta-1,3-N-acetylgalactosaminyltransferase 1-like [Mercenaria mercenaria]|uniref:UDP-GalNAc:beta-1, 3-N-acetylgalactosaminyltransferase 1-like n=1 Tax=Mercenaria mercenaria TaxID=6596 RepID=UPI00234EB8D1|nr:UDP-GalNAc:beta-1,3-N-acetylgalactosaminyltransferase 1-like [Mercenaria mercenaria]